MEAQVPIIGTSLLAAELASVKRCGNWRPLAGHVRPRQNLPSAGRPQLRGQPHPSAHEPPGAVLAPLAVPGNFPKRDDKLPPPGRQVCQCWHHGLPRLLRLLSPSGRPRPRGQRGRGNGFLLFSVF